MANLRSSRSNLRSISKLQNKTSNSNLKTTNKLNYDDDNEERGNVEESSSVESIKKGKGIEFNVVDELESQVDEGGDDLPPATSALLYPPLYGRPKPSPSPDLFSTLLHPLLSLSRPPSPSPSSSNLPSLSSPSPLPSSTSESSSQNDRSSSSLPAHFPPRTSSDPGPTVESQGFVLYLGSLVLWIAYLVWGFGSDNWLRESLGISWYPSREWALLFPAWTIMLAFFVYFSYIALNIFITPNLDSLHTLTDTQAYILTPPSSSIDNTPHPLIANSILLPLDAVPVLHDLPIGLVNRVVMGDFRRKR